MRSSVVAIGLMAWLAPALAAAQTAQPTPAPAEIQTSPSAPSIHGFGDHDKTCLVWTDKCSSCQRGDGDTITCSNIGIACQPAEITCSSRQTAPAK
jgi:hypothetical protein